MPHSTSGLAMPTFLARMVSESTSRSQSESRSEKPHSFSFGAYDCARASGREEGSRRRREEREGE